MLITAKFKISQPRGHQLALALLSVRKQTYEQWAFGAH
jgi:hypothetical protein